MVQPVKIQKKDELVDLLQNAKCVILSDFTGLNVSDISKLRRACHDRNVTYTVIKNTLAKKSFSELGIEGLDPYLEGPTAMAVSVVDEAAPAQVLKAFADDFELPRLKGGYVAGRVIGAAEAARLASLPSRETLLTQVVGMMQAPMRGLVGALSASLRDLVGVLNAVSEKKGA